MQIPEQLNLFSKYYPKGKYSVYQLAPYGLKALRAFIKSGHYCNSVTKPVVKILFFVKKLAPKGGVVDEVYYN